MTTGSVRAAERASRAALEDVLNAAARYLEGRGPCESSDETEAASCGDELCLYCRLNATAFEADRALQNERDVERAAWRCAHLADSDTPGDNLEPEPCGHCGLYYVDD